MQAEKPPSLGNFITYPINQVRELLGHLRQMIYDASDTATGQAVIVITTVFCVIVGMIYAIDTSFVDFHSCSRHGGPAHVERYTPSVVTTNGRVSSSTILVEITCTDGYQYSNNWVSHAPE